MELPSGKKLFFYIDLLDNNNIKMTHENSAKATIVLRPLKDFKDFYSKYKDYSMLEATFKLPDRQLFLRNNEVIASDGTFNFKEFIFISKPGTYSILEI